MSYQKRMKTDERQALFGLYALHESLKTFYEPLKKWLTDDKYALRGLKASEKHIDRALTEVLKGLPPDERSYVVKNCKDFETRIRPKMIAKDDVWMYVKVDDLQELIKLARASECDLCVKDRCQQGACPLRKILGILANEPESIFECGFKGGGL